MKFYIYEDSLYHKCNRGDIHIYDNLYIPTNNKLTCPKCKLAVPLIITAMFPVIPTISEYYRVGLSTHIYIDHPANDFIYRYMPNNFKDKELEIAEEE